MEIPREADYIEDDHSGQRVLAQVFVIYEFPR